jgi:hypothetical protein
MRFSEIMRRVTRISAFGFGAEWQPPDSEYRHMREILSFLEDRRVLYIPSEAESPQHCVSSVLEIRQVLTNQLPNFRDEDTIGSLRAMRAACRKFLTPAEEQELLFHAHQSGHWANWQFVSALGELRGVFGVHVAKLAAKYKIDIEDHLAVILPDEDIEDRIRPATRRKSKR